MKESIKKKLEFLTKETRTNKTRFLISLAVHFFAVFSFVFYTSSEVYLKSIADFDFTFLSLVLVIGCASIILLAVGIGISMLLKGRLFNYYITTVFSFALCAYLQGTFMNSSLPALDGTAVQWHLLTGASFINLIIWIVIFALPYILHFFNRKVWKKAIVYISCLCIIMNAVSLVSLIFSSNLSENENKGFYSKENLYEVSDEGDVVVLVLDYFDSEYMDNLLEENPDILSEWTGFTRFVNCTSMYKQTMPSIPYILTGTKWHCETTSWEFSPIAFSSADFLQRVDSLGAEINLYVSGTANADQAYELSDNYKSNGSKIKPLGMFTSMLNYMFYRNMPLITKSVFWHYTDDISNASIETENLSAEETAYTIDDAAFLDGLQENGIIETDNKSFKFVHMKGAHLPYTIDEFGEPSNESYAVRQRKGSLYIVSQYLAEMKDKGLYDDTTIIIMADHGEVEVADEMSRAALPILFVKPAGADSSAPFTTSTAPVSQEDFRATVLWALGDENYSDFGRTFFEISEDEERIRNFYFRVSYEGKPEERLIEYEITGDARDFSNWSLTGKSWRVE